MNKYLAFAAGLGALTIALGAFGAHALKETLTIEVLKSFETGVRYQMYHIIVLLFVNIYTEFTQRSKKRLNFLFLSGIMFFSGSIYAIAFGVPAKFIWFITPLGGLFFILGWVYMAISFVKKT
jgi:uncharacterized membrane protein YgdD (TMEM256/DUF423 family)